MLHKLLSEMTREELILHRIALFLKKIPDKIKKSFESEENK